MRLKKAKILFASLIIVAIMLLITVVAFLFLPELNYGIAKAVIFGCLFLVCAASMGGGLWDYLKKNRAECLIAAVVGMVLNCTYLALAFALIN